MPHYNVSSGTSYKYEKNVLKSEGESVGYEISKDMYLLYLFPSTMREYQDHGIIICYNDSACEDYPKYLLFNLG